MDLFTSPELFPLKIDFERRIVQCLRMSPQTYRESVFLDERAQYIEAGIEIRLDDLLLAHESCSPATRRMHYVLNSAFCGSTLLARYFELLPSCFVLKEPRILAQLAVNPQPTNEGWMTGFLLSLRLLSRAYAASQTVIIKPLESCNRLGALLLQHCPNATATYLTVPLKRYLLAILKSDDRRGWVRQRAQNALRDVADCPVLSGVDPQSLTTAQAAAFLWLVDRFMCSKLLSGPHSGRIREIDGEDLVASPRAVISSVAEVCGLPLDQGQLDSMVGHASMQRYSKGPGRPYDKESRNREMTELERCWGGEADTGLEWAKFHSTSSL